MHWPNGKQTESRANSSSSITTTKQQPSEENRNFLYEFEFCVFFFRLFIFCANKREFAECGCAVCDAECGSLNSNLLFFDRSATKASALWPCTMTEQVYHTHSFVIFILFYSALWSVWCVVGNDRQSICGAHGWFIEYCSSIQFVWLHPWAVHQWINYRNQQHFEHSKSVCFVLRMAKKRGSKFQTHLLFAQKILHILASPSSTARRAATVKHPHHR